jgi:tetratricopeptide (TPR) repeat protein
MVHQGAGDYDEAEAAYRRSLEIATQSNNRAGQARSLNQLGQLYGDYLGRLEEAVIFYRQAADIFVELGDLRFEGVVRNNIADTLCKLKRYDKARPEIMRAIACYQPFGTAVELWKSFNILQQIEVAVGDETAARAAWVQARDAYLAYRQHGGYAQQGNRKLVDHVLGLLAQQKDAEIEPLFKQLAADPNASASLKRLMQMMLMILNGSRDATLADDSALNFADAAEVLFLIQRLSSGRDGAMSG